MGSYKIKPVTAQDYRTLARKRLPRFLFEYIDGGGNNEQTMAANEADFRRLILQQRVMRDVSNVDTSTTLSGQKVSMPLALSPLGLAGMMARRGEAQAARAAVHKGIPFSLSTVGICSLDEVQKAANSPPWFQLYMFRDRDLVTRLLEHAEAAGSETLVFTVDLAVTGVRHRDIYSGMQGRGLRYQASKAWQLMSHPHWLVDVGLLGKPHSFGVLGNMFGDSKDLNAYQNFIGSQFDSSVTWKDIAWLRSIWKGKILIKGVMSPDDAQAAVDSGADGVIVSNHGGRQLDGVASTISTLPHIVKAVGPQCEVYLDSGVRSGMDVVKAVALGANGVMMGRPWIWAVAARGEQGLCDLLDVFKREIATAMALMGVNRIEELNNDLIGYY